MTKVLVTGATGFIGSALTKFLKQKEYYVIGLSRHKKQLARQEEGIDEWVQFDLLGEEAEFIGILKEVDFLIHLAGNAHETRELPYSSYYQLNTLPATFLAKSALANGVKKIVYVSTIKVNESLESNHEDYFISEQSPVNTQDNYSLSKHEAEISIEKICKDSDVQFVILRPPLVFGANVKANFLALIKLVDLGLPLPFASVNNSRSFIYVENLCAIIELCLSSENVNGQRYLVKDVSVSLPNLIGIISESLNSRTALFPCPTFLLRWVAAIFGKKDAIQKLVSSLNINDQKIRKDLSWEPLIDFKTSIQKTVNWYQGRQDC